MSAERLELLRAKMKSWDSDGSYYAITLTVNEQGGLMIQRQTNFAGFADDRFHHNREMRVAAQVYPDKMTNLWRSMGEDYLVVDDRESLFIFLHLGGNALVE
jgi:hypothetical protein